MKQKKNTAFENDYSDQLDCISLKNIFSNKRNIYSSTVGLYDVMPKYFYGNMVKARHHGKYLDVISRNFSYQNKNMTLTITPARLLVSKNISLDFFPSASEEIVEFALRKIATDLEKYEFINDKLSVRFNLNDLWKELKKMGHSYNYNQIKESLLILSRTNLTVKSEDESIIFSSNMFEKFGYIDKNLKNKDKNEQLLQFDFLSRNDSEYNNKIEYFITFNNLITESVENKTWRLINYNQLMSYKKSISRWLHKRMSNRFSISSTDKPYHINLSTIIRDSGLCQYEELRCAINQIKLGLEEMIKAGTISKYEIDYKYSKYRDNKIDDATFFIYISETFFKDLKLNVFAHKRPIKKTLIKDNELYKLFDLDDINCDPNKNEINETKNDNNTQQINKTETTKEVQNNVTQTPYKHIGELLKSAKIEKKNIVQILSKIHKKNNLEQVENNIQAGINYINQQTEKGIECNNFSIILSAINQNWQVNKYKQNTNKKEESNNKKEESNTSVSDEKIKQEQEIKQVLSSITDENFRQLTKKMVDYFGYTRYNIYVQPIKFVSFENNVITLETSNCMVYEYVDRDYMRNDYKVDYSTGEKTLFRKGILGLARELFPGVKIVFNLLRQFFPQTRTYE